MRPAISTMACSRAPLLQDLVAATSRRPYSTHFHQRLRAPPLRPSPLRCIKNHLPAQQQRHASFWGNARKVYRSNPISVILAGIAIVFGAGTLLSVNYYYFKYLRLHNYPEEVAKKLRRASYYSSVDPQPAKAVQYFKDAILAAQEVGMDAWSDEVIGIKIAIAGLMEKLEQYDKQITAYEVIRRDCLAKSKEYEAQPGRMNDRTRLLKWATSIGVKLGELYSLPEVWNREAAEKHLSWAVQTMIQERQRRNNLNITNEQEGEWMSNEELAATIEGLADNYESKDQHYLAAPLFLHAINLHPMKSCHTVILMNNLASSLSQQSPKAAAIVQAQTDSQSIVEKRPTVPVSREMLLQMAQTWAQNALNVASQIAPPERTDECDIGCAVTTHNLGELAEMTRNFEEAKKRYREAISLSRAIGFQEGVENSSARLRKLEQQG